MPYLANPVVTVNSVDLTGYCTGATYNYRKDSLESTVFGNTARNFQAGLENNEVTLDLFLSYGVGEVWATLEALLGVSTTITLKPSSGVDSATNPKSILTGAVLFELPVVSATVGELSQISVTFQGGTYSKDTTNP